MKTPTLLLSVLFTACALRAESPRLAEVFRPYFPIGMGVDRQDLDAPDVWELVKRHASSVTVENAMKPGPTQPRPGEFTFERADRVVAAARDAGLEIHGHTLVWHRSTPDWMFEDQNGDPVSKDLLRERLRAHIQGVAGHYRGKVVSWDVVNEALADGGGESDFRNSPWYQILGFEYLLEAFLAAEAADPEALLFYNDYGLEKDPKRTRALRLIQRLRDAGAKVDGIGIQAHLQVDSPSISEIEQSILAFREAGLKIHISELDVSMYPWRRPGSELIEADRIHEDGLTEEGEAALTQRYAELFALFRKHHQSIYKVTFWNTHDGRSWLNNHPVRGRVDHPLLFDRDLNPKPAFHRVVEEAKEDLARPLEPDVE